MMTTKKKDVAAMSFWLKGNLFALVLAYLLRLVSKLVG